MVLLVLVSLWFRRSPANRNPAGRGGVVLSAWPARDDGRLRLVWNLMNLMALP